MPALLGEKGKPKIKPSRLEPEKKARQQKENLEDHASEENQEKKKRPGSEKRDKTASLTIHETKIIQPTEEIPPDSEFKGYQDYTVQERSYQSPQLKKNQDILGLFRQVRYWCQDELLPQGRAA